MGTNESVRPPDSRPESPGQPSPHGRAASPRAPVDLPGRPHAIPEPTPDPDAVDRQLLHRAGNGDDAAFAELLHRHDPALRLLVTCLAGPGEIDRVLRLTYVRAYRDRSEGGGDCPPGLWLARLTLLAILDELRRQARARRRRRREAAASTSAKPGDKPPPAELDRSRPTDGGGVRILPGGERQDPSASTGGLPAGRIPPPENNRPDDDADQRPEATPDRPVVLRAAGKLLLEDRVALILVDGLGLRPARAAIVADVSASTIATRVHRARRDLAIHLDVPGMIDAAQLLRAVPVADHGPGFWRQLGGDLVTAVTTPAARGPSPAPARPSFPPPPMVPPPGAGKKRGADRRTVSGLAYRANQTRSFATRNRRWRVAGAAAAVVVVVVAAGLVVANRANRHDQQVGSTFDKALDSVDSALAGDAVVQATVTVTGSSPQVPAGSYNVLRTNTGSYRVESFAPYWNESYDASTGTFQIDGDLSTSGGTKSIEVNATGLAPGPPDPTAASPFALGDPFTAFTQIVRSGVNLQLTSIQGNGVPLSVIDADLPRPFSGKPTVQGIGILPGFGSFANRSGADHVRMVIDQSLRLPTDITLTRDRNVVADLRVSNVTIGAPLQAGTFDVAFRPGLAPPASSSGFTTMPVAQLTQAVGYNVPTPSYLPPGFVLATAAALPSPVEGAGSTAGGRNPPNMGVASLSYRFGSQQIVVTTRKLAGRPGKAWTDPFSTPAPVATDHTQISSGTFLGAGAARGDQPLPHVWGHNHDLVFTVAGSVDTNTLTRVAASLH